MRDWAAVVLFIAGLLIALAIPFAIRSKAIADCQDMAGQTVTSQWYQGDEFFKVRCIYPVQR